MSATTTQLQNRSLPGWLARVVLIVWTIGIWGSRLRNIVTDDELAGTELVLAVVVAGFLIAAALAVGYSMKRNLVGHGRALGILVIAGIARFTTRGIAILVNSEFDTGFKVVHTVLWVITVVLSVLAAREYAAERQSTVRS